MHIDRSSIIDTAWFLLSLVLLGIGSTQPGITGIVIQALGFFVMGVAVFIQAWFFQILTQSYPYIRLRLLPSKKTLHLFCKKTTSQRTTKTDWATTIELAFDVKHYYYGKLQSCVLHHAYPREKRFNFDHGLCVFHGYAVDHPRVEELVAYEYPRGSYDLDHTKPVPAFHVALASNDYFLEFGEEHTNPGLNPLAGMVRQLQHEANEKTREAMDYKQKFIREEERSKHIQNELTGVLKGEMDFDSAVTERMLAIRRSQLRIVNAIKSAGRTISVGKAAAILAVCALATFILLFNPQGIVTNAGEWIRYNPVISIIFGVMACAMIFFVFRRKR